MLKGAFARIADPYLNTDAGTMSPFEHGEVFVLDDGGEVCYFNMPLFEQCLAACERWRPPTGVAAAACS